MTSIYQRDGPVERRALKREDLFFGLLLLACANGLTWRALEAVNRLNWRDAFLNTFDISAIVWLSCLFGLLLLSSSRAKDPEPSRRDWTVGSVILILILVPIGVCSWLAVAVACIYLIVTEPDESARRGAAILLAVTVPMLWARVVYRFLAQPILTFDASLVGWILGTPRHGNVVGFLDQSGNLVVEIPCSSLANVSLALLCWIAVSQFVKHRPRRSDLFWCALACLSVVAVNVFRMATMGISAPVYEAVHGGYGAAVVNFIESALIMVFTGLGVRRELSRMV
jgi:hypothetical protein